MRRLLALALLIPFAAHAQELKTEERITVERILVDARVTDSFGDPILGLTPADFRVRIDGKLAKVESVDWIPETSVAREMADIEKPPVEINQTMNQPAPRGRLFVYFVQTDFARNKSRIGGQMHFLPFADELIENLEEEDRVAVFSYDSHLKFRLDFTNRKSDIREAIRSAMLIDEPQPPPTVPMPSLGRQLDRDEMRKVANPERALTVVANALRPITGPKSMILFGWGLGYKVGHMISMGPDYAVARRALEASRVTVFSLDMSIADYHDLEVGLKTASADTGGFYAKTHIFPQIAVDRLQKTLAGHYELEVRKPDTKVVGVHTIEVETTKKGALVMARGSYIDKGE